MDQALSRLPSRRFFFSEICESRRRWSPSRRGGCRCCCRRSIGSRKIVRVQSSQQILQGASEMSCAQTVFSRHRRGQAHQNLRGDRQRKQSADLLSAQNVCVQSVSEPAAMATRAAASQFRSICTLTAKTRAAMAQRQPLLRQQQMVWTSCIQLAARAAAWWRAAWRSLRRKFFVFSSRLLYHFASSQASSVLFMRGIHNAVAMVHHDGVPEPHLLRGSHGEHRSQQFCRRRHPAAHLATGNGSATTTGAAAAATATTASTRELETDCRNATVPLGQASGEHTGLLISHEIHQP